MPVKRSASLTEEVSVY